MGKLLPLGLVLIAGCEARAAPLELADKVKAVRERMHQRFEASKRIQLAIALGQLERAQAEARTIDKLEEPDALPEWRVYIDNVRAAARQVVAAKDTVSAARMGAQLGRECAKCHEAIKARIVFPRDPAPPKDARLPSQMFSHQWATTRMWEGLIAPSDDRWLAGAKALETAPLDVAAESGDLGIANDVARVRLFARRARTPQSQAERAQLYGDLLGTCAHCHFTIRD